MIRNLDPGLVRAFVTVAATRNMTAAADQLNLTQGAVSQQIRRLEDVLQTALFDRGQRGLRLTRQGERLLSLSNRFLALNDEILATMRGEPEAVSVRFGLPYDLVTSWLPKVLPGFAEARPRVDIDLVCGASMELRARLEAGELDVAIIEEPAATARGECLRRERLVWLGSANGTAHRKRPLPLSMVSDACVFRPGTHAALHAAEIDWRVVFENGNLEAALTTVRSGLAVLPYLEGVVPDDMDILPPDYGLPALPDFSISLFVRENHGNPAADELADHIRRALADRGRRRAA